MVNMPYCRFENTFNALVECLEDLDLNGGHEHLSKSEKRYLFRLGEMAAEMAQYAEMIEGEKND
jgi:hypothetical protein